MFNKFASIVLVLTLVSTLLGTPATAQTKWETKTHPLVVTQQGEILSENLRANQNLRADIFKLVAEVKAGGDVVKIPAPQIHRQQRNNLSKGAKIAIGVGIAAAVVVVILVAQYCRNEQGC
ncbi:MAG TPA: hypothetical protein VJ023_15880 [Pyrinomonadaceae bacterium]|nr:hypothetical protein [Pyrinomonadaceae bacterium]